jgi:hypothetical protein
MDTDNQADEQIQKAEFVGSSAIAYDFLRAFAAGLRQQFQGKNEFGVGYRAALRQVEVFAESMVEWNNAAKENNND